MAPKSVGVKPEQAEGHDFHVNLEAIYIPRLMQEKIQYSHYSEM